MSSGTSSSSVCFKATAVAVIISLSVLSAGYLQVRRSLLTQQVQLGGSIMAASAGGNFTRNIITIFCFGDSLTAGNRPNGDGSLYPYAKPLKEMVGPSEIRWAGFPGWTTKDLRNNVNVPSSSRSQDGLEIQLQKDDYDVVVILAGTNDLGRGIEPEDIVDNLTFLYGLCHSHNVSKVLAVAIPDSHYLARNSDARGRRDRVTELMEKYGNESRGFLSVVRPTFGWSDGGKTLYDRDGLHLNELGYERLAKDVAAAIMKHVPKAKK